MDAVEVLELVVKCQVPREEVDEYVCKLRHGDRLVSVPNDFTCRDAFDCGEDPSEATAVIRACYKR